MMLVECVDDLSREFRSPQESRMRVPASRSRCARVGRRDCGRWSGGLSVSFDEVRGVSVVVMMMMMVVIMMEMLSVRRRLLGRKEAGIVRRSYFSLMVRERS
jgi:hypothetical protein